MPDDMLDDQPRYLVGQTMVHIDASFDVAGLKRLQDALPMLIALITLHCRRAAPLETAEEPAGSAASSVGTARAPQPAEDPAGSAAPQPPA